MTERDQAKKNLVLLLIAGICGLFAIESAETITISGNNLLPRAYSVPIIESRERWTNFFYVLLFIVFFGLSAWIILRLLKYLFPSSFLFKPENK
ncbi:hypothetical protein ACFE6N_22850 [Pedobacter sp. BG31]|uniref:hypothetical protein n=1 Tax=Pedobacter sp. BG31 TaxID=3349697 RepID=UPI0035F44122